MSGANQQAKLNLVITAQDKAKNVIKKFAENLASSINEIQRALGEGLNMTPLEEAVNTGAKAVANANKSIKESTQQTAQGVKQASGEMATATQGAMHHVAQAIEEFDKLLPVTRTQLETFFNSFKHTMDEWKNVDAIDVSTKQLKEFYHTLNDGAIGRELVVIGEDAQKMQEKMSQSFTKVNETWFASEEAVRKFVTENISAFGKLNMSTEEMANLTAGQVKKIAQALTGVPVEVLARKAEESVPAWKQAMDKYSSTMYMTKDEIVAYLKAVGAAEDNESLKTKEWSQLTVSELAKIASAYGNMSVKVVNDLEQPKQGMSRLTEVLSDAGIQMAAQQIGSAMTSMGRAALGAFKDAITSSMEFEQNISRIHAVLMGREPMANMQAMSDMALKLGQSSKFSANEQAQGMYELARQGLSSTQILGDGINGAIQIVNDLAQATDTDMKSTSRVITDVMHEFGTTGDGLRNVANMISGAMHNSSISMDDFFYSMKQVGPVANAMHQSVDDVSTSIALLASHGIPASSAGTAIKNMLLGLEPHTKKAANLMHDLGISAKEGAADSFYQLNGNLKPMPEIIGLLNNKFGDLNDKQKQAALSAVFTKYGLAGLNVVVGEGKDKFEELKNSLADDNAQKIAAEKMNNLAGDTQKLGASWETLKKSFGDSVAPSLRPVVEWLNDMAKKFEELDPQTKKAIMWGTGVSGAFLLITGAAISLSIAIGVLSLAIEILEVPLLPIIATVAIVMASLIALGVIIYEVCTHWDDIKKATSVAWDWIKSTTSTAVTATVNFFHKLKEGISKAVSDMYEWVKAKAKQLFIEFVEMNVRIVLGAVEAWKNIKQWVSEHVSDMITAVTDWFNKLPERIAYGLGYAYEIITKGIPKWYNEFVKWLSNLPERIEKWFSDAAASVAKWVQNVYQDVEKWVSETYNSFVKWLTGLPDRISKWFSDLRDNAVKHVTDMAHSVGTWIENTYNQFVNWLSNLPSRVSTWFSNTRDSAVQVTQDLVSGVGNWLTHLPEKFSDAISAAGDAIRNMGSSMLQWGQGLVDSLVDGIMSKVHKIRDAFSAGMSDASKVVETHSPPKEGPMRFIDRWGKGLVQTYADAISGSGHLIKAAMSTSLSDAVGSVNGTGSGATSYDAQRGTVTGAVAAVANATRVASQIPVNNSRSMTQQTVVQINIDGRSYKTDNDLAEAIAQKFRTQVRMAN